MNKPDETIWHDHPAGTEWLRALPLGNGRMGAMVFGNPDLERIQLNEDTFYALEPDSCCFIPEGIPEQLPGVIDLLKAGKIKEAEKHISRNWQGRSNAPYQPLADLWIEPGHTDVSSFTHQLSLSEAVATCRYTVHKTTYTREAFLSAPDQVLVVRLTSDTPEALSFSTWVDSPHHATLRSRIEGTRFYAQGKGPGEALRRSDRKIKAWGDEHKYPDFYQQNPDGTWARRPGTEGNILYAEMVDGKGMSFEVQLQVIATGGSCSEHEGRLRVEGADEVLLLLSSDTSFNGIDKSPSREGVDPSVQASRDLNTAAGRSFAELRQRHVKDYQSLYTRAEIQLGPPGPGADRPTDQRLARYHEGNDPTLPVLYYAFSRYLMIAGSRPGTEPLNLQGIWNEEIIPPWNSGYTTNINAEMNYWDAHRANLTECAEPFLRMVQETYGNGKKVATEIFGYRGWCMFHNISIWRSAAPVDGAARTSWWPVGAGWYCQHLWHHFLMTRDTSFLKSAFPILRDAALFFSDWLIDRGDGALVTPVSTSPENIFYYEDENGTRKSASVCMGSTMDRAIVWETLTNTLQAAKELDLPPDADLKEIQQTRDRLADYRLRANGALQEWSDDFEEGEPEHRHISHLYGFFPGEEITPESRPDLVPAVRTTLENRGDGASGWAMGWKLTCWARLGDGAHFQKLLGNLLTPERTAQNMLCLHPPYQIDGNFGTARGITEALVQDHRGFIDLLPALPPNWPEGRVRGIRCRGGLTIDLCWQGGTLKEAQVTSDPGGSYTFHTGDRVFEMDLAAGVQKDLINKIPADNGKNPDPLAAKRLT